VLSNNLEHLPLAR